MATCPVQSWNEQKGGDPRAGHPTKGTTRTPGWHPEEKEAQLPLVSEKRYSQISVGCVSAQRRGGPRTPVRQREGPEDPLGRHRLRLRIDGAFFVGRLTQLATLAGVYAAYTARKVRH